MRPLLRAAPMLSHTVHEEPDMNSGYPLLQALYSEESGQDMVEYALLGLLIAFAAIAVSQLGGSIANQWNNTFNQIINAL